MIRKNHSRVLVSQTPLYKDSNSDYQYDASGIIGGPANNERSLWALEEAALPTEKYLRSGVIHQFFPGLYLYRVVLDYQAGEMICADSSATDRLSTKVSFPYSIGTRVLTYRSPGSVRGVIICPLYLEDEFKPEEESIPLSVSSVLKYDFHNRFYMKGFMNGELSYGMRDLSHIRASDGLSGDYSVLNLFGGGFHTDMFQTFIRQSPSCGVWAFMFNQLLRLSGHSIQEYSAAHERYQGLDEGETYGYEGVALYPYEALGYTSGSGTLWKKTGGQVEPADKDLRPFYRLQKYTGFIGQGAVETVSIPPKSSGNYTANADKQPIAVSRCQKTLDGSLTFESSRGIHFVLQPNIRSFKRVKDIADPQGDDLAKGNYGFSKTDAFDKEPESDAAVTDKILWAVRQAGNAGFYAHKNDFELIKTEQRAFEKDVDSGDLRTLQTQPKISNAPKVKLKINDDDIQVEYGGSRAFFSLINEGLFIRGTCGEEYRMEGGNITVSCPGNLTMMPGRSFVVMAGEDAVVKAKKSVDIAAVDNDVRVKAERNLEMAGGMSGSGRTLIENKSKGVPDLNGIDGKEGEEISGGGLVIKATDSLSVLQSKQVFIQSGKGGEIFINGGLEKGAVNIHGRNVNVRSSSLIELAAGIYEGAQTVEGSGNPVRIYSSTVSVPRSLMVYGSVYANRVVADEGCNKDPLDEKDKIFKPDGDADKSLKSANESTDKQIESLYGNYEDEGRIGSEEMQKKYTFSFRNSQQCGAETFDFISPYWMELFKPSVVSALPLWDEPVYSYQSEAESSGLKQTSWPGYQAWAEDEKLEVRKPVWYDAENGSDKDGPDAPTESSAAEKHVPAQYYRVIKK